MRRAVLLAKRGRALALCELLMWRLPAEPPLAAATVTWVPGHPRRVMAAPDAGNALARAVARHYDLPLAQLLTRSVWGRRQAGHSAEVRRERSEQLRLSVRGAVPDRVLVVDDVRTTGATLDRVGTLLRAAGARQVEAIVVASARLPSA